MDMGAHFLASLGGAKSANDGHLVSIMLLGRQAQFAVQLRVKFCRSSLIVVDTIQAEAEDVHQGRRQINVEVEKRSQRGWSMMRMEFAVRRSRKRAEQW